MKSFKEYLAESKKTYSFRVKVAGDLPEKFESNLKSSLEKWSVVDMSKTSTPVQKVPLDFPDKENMEVHIFDVTLEYPVTDQVLQAFIPGKTGVSGTCLRVRNANDPLEYQQLPKEDEKYEVKLLTDLEDAVEGAQKIAGEEHKMTFLASINKVKPSLEQYKGVNDAILAKSAPSEKAVPSETKTEKQFSTLGNKKMPDPKGIRK